MKILLIEDDFDKKEKIKEYLYSDVSPDVTIVDKESLRSALQALISAPEYDLIILDMSLPNFDINEDEPGGGTPESFAGKELMAQMDLRSIVIPTIVVTQYSSFEGGRVTLDNLRADFKKSYNQFYVGLVYYNAATEEWKKDLHDLMEKAL